VRLFLRPLLVGYYFVSSQTLTPWVPLIDPATLMKSSDKSVEFTTGDMAGKHAAVEWVIEHAPAIFRVAES
jgi:hypothetical protein